MSFRILLADESSTIKKAFEIGLTSYGAEIKNVQHGIDVIEVAESFRPDIIFADVLISKMNGYEVCAKIKEHPRLQTTPVVLMWSGFMDIDEDKYVTCQADGKIEKPFSADQLIQLIHNLVQNNTPQHPQVVTNSVIKKVTDPTEDLLFKKDLYEAPNHLNPQTNNTQDPQDSNDEDFNLDGFEAFDIQNSQNIQDQTHNLDYKQNQAPTGSNQEFGQFNPHNFKDIYTDSLTSSLSSSKPATSASSNSNSLDENNLFLDELEDLDELNDGLENDLQEEDITVLPTPDEEEMLFKKLNEDTAIRHGSGFLTDDLQDLLSSEDEDIYGPDLMSQGQKNEDKTLQPKRSQPVPEHSNHQSSKTIHRNVSDFATTAKPDTPLTANKSSFEINTSDQNVIGTLSREEIKQIISEQAKDMIQSIVWEMVPELSKQMIEKEIKRLMAESGDELK